MSFLKVHHRHGFQNILHQDKQLLISFRKSFFFWHTLIFNQFSLIIERFVIIDFVPPKKEMIKNHYQEFFKDVLRALCSVLVILNQSMDIFE